jgi:hypothetical protein
MLRVRVRVMDVRVSSACVLSLSLSLSRARALALFEADFHDFRMIQLLTNTPSSGMPRCVLETRPTTRRRLLDCNRWVRV